MRFDNPIHSHKFKKMYDIAEFKEIKNEYRQTRDVDSSYLKKYFKNNNFEAFDKELKNIIELSYKEKKIDVKEDKYYFKWKEKLDRYFHFYQNFKINSKIITGSQTFNDLFKKGFSFQKISKENIDSINKKLSAKIKKLYKTPKKIKGGNQEYDRRVVLNDKWKFIINEMFINEGILDGIRAYYNKPNMKVEKVTLMIITDEDVSPFLFLQDCKKIPRHTNMHIDPLEGYMQSMIYLSDVKERDGGTQMLPESNRYVYDELQNVFARSVNTGNFCHNPIARSVLFRLPKFLRVTFGWGRLVDSGSEMEKYLDKKMIKFISKKHGNCSVFESGAILHNAKVEKGSRISLQVIFH